MKEKCDNYKREKCWSQMYIEDYVTDTNVGNISDNVSQERLMLNNPSTTAVNIQKEYMRILLARLRKEGVNG